jgi:molybdate transport system substrate-binding protein
MSSLQRMQSLRRLAPRVARVLVALTFVSSCGGAASSSPSDTPALVIAAASDLRPAFEELAEQFTNDTNVDVTFSFGSSGQLREQILNGAPFDVFASANAEFVDEIIEQDRGLAATKTNYAIGRIVLWSSEPETLPDSITDLTSSSFARIAIANPTHAPYGLAAQQAFISAGIWNEIEKKIVYGENISDTKKIIDSGNADIGVIALSLAIADGRPYVEIPNTLHKQLLQAAVVTTTGEQQDAAKQWLDFMSSPAGLSVMKKYGFIAPNGMTTKK